MPNVQVRLPDELEAPLDALAKRLRGNRSDAIRVALSEGLQALAQREALEAYVQGSISLERAAHDAGLSLHEMAVRAGRLGVPYARYAPEEADRDLEALG